jgi:hypothetical protein
MPFMSYCRFEQTFNELAECQRVLQENSLPDLEEKASKYEKEYFVKVIKLCQEIASEFGNQNQ